MNKALKLINALILLTLLVSCGKEIFSVPKNTKKSNTPNVGTNSAFNCSQSTLIRPPVDILILMDNSTSTNYISAQMKQSLTNIVNQVSSRFDYHIVLAPLLIGNGESVNSQMKLVVRDPSTVSASAQSYIIPKSSASAYLNFDQRSGSYEAGLTRVNSILKANISNNIFRKSAYTIVTIVSNGDDNSWVGGGHPIPADRIDYIDNKFKELMCIRGNHAQGSGCTTSQILNAKMMRFLSIVVPDGNTSCSSAIGAHTESKVYVSMSNKVYSAPYTNGTPLPTDQTGEAYPDLVNLCTTNPLTVFNSINSIIQDVTIKHVYRYWPVANSNFDLDESTIVATQNNGQVLTRLSNTVVANIVRDPNGKNDTYFGNQISGWYYHGNDFVDTRFLPTTGEPFDGHVIELFGNAKVTFPSCLKVTSKAMPNYYGFAFVSAYKPLESTLQVYINGNKISQSPTSGWELLPTKYSNGHYVEIMGPGNYAQKAGGKSDNRSGYYIKLNGPAVYSNNSTIQIQSQSTSN